MTLILKCIELLEHYTNVIINVEDKSKDIYLTVIEDIINAFNKIKVKLVFFEVNSVLYYFFKESIRSYSYIRNDLLRIESYEYNSRFYKTITEFNL